MYIRNMPRLRTTVAVHPDKADRLREIKQANDLESMNEALGHVLEEVNAGA